VVSATVDPVASRGNAAGGPPAAARRETTNRPTAGLPWTVWTLALVIVVIELAFGPRYGLFRDEYYYLACADHLGWGYVDHPPLSIAVLAAVRAVLGDSLPAVRLVPALLGGTLVVLGALLARALGGGRRAQLLGAVAVAAVPEYLGQAGCYSMNILDTTCWAVAALLLARLAPDERGWRRFVTLGVVLGLGLLNKLSLLFFGAGLAVALIVTPLRRLLLKPGPWLAAVIAALLFAPHVLWQVANGFPTREFIENATRYKNVALTPLQFLGGSLLDMNPVTAPLWIAGLGWLLLARRAQRFRSLGIVYLVAFAILAAQHSKPYYLAPAYPPLLAAGAVLLEGARRRWMTAATGAVLLVAGAALAPFAIPALPVETFIAYQHWLGVSPPQSERAAQGLLPQFFADHFGWPELTQAVADVYRSLPADEQRRVAIVTSNYGEAGALNYLGRRYGLPPAVSQHNSFYLWGPGRDRVDVAIVVGMNPENLGSSWSSVEVGGRWYSPYAMPWQHRWPILVCRGLKIPLPEAWRRGKHFI